MPFTRNWKADGDSPPNCWLFRATGTGGSVERLIFAPVIAPFLIFAPVTAPFLTFALVTAPFLS